MSKGNTFENDLLKLIFNAVPIPGLADNAAASPLTQLHMALHTGDPGETGDQTTVEAVYTPYARAPVARTSAGWAVTANSVSPVANIDFPTCTAGGPISVTHATVGTTPSGAGKVLYRGPITPNLSVNVGVTPRLTTASTVTED